jgi:isopenicillin N synthase-like dioxygenase
VRVPPADRRSVARVSIPFFHHPNWDAVIECLPSCTSADVPPRHEPVTAGDYLRMKVHAAYT